jgi:uncharacterized protein YjbJ (UPF0337 family)
MHAVGLGSVWTPHHTAARKDVTMAADAKGEKFKGRGKEALGDLTGNEDLKREGKLDQASGEAKEKFGEAADKVKDALSGDDRR